MPAAGLPQPRPPCRCKAFVASHQQPAPPAVSPACQCPLPSCWSPANFEPAAVAGRDALRRRQRRRCQHSELSCAAPRAHAASSAAQQPSPPEQAIWGACKSERQMAPPLCRRRCGRRRGVGGQRRRHHARWPPRLPRVHGLARLIIFVMLHTCQQELGFGGETPCDQQVSRWFPWVSDLIWVCTRFQGCFQARKLCIYGRDNGGGSRNRCLLRKASAAEPTVLFTYKHIPQRTLGACRAQNQEPEGPGVNSLLEAVLAPTFWHRLAPTAEASIGTRFGAGARRRESGSDWNGCWPPPCSNTKGCLQCRLNALGANLSKCGSKLGLGWAGWVMCV